MTKTILITGAAGNLGKAAVEKFSAEGHRIIALVSPGSDFTDSNQSVSVHQVNLADEKEVEVLLKKLLSEGTIEAAVLTVGGFSMGSIESTNGDAIQKMMTLNFNTAYFIGRTLFTQMLSRQSGRIVLVGARPALVAEEGKNTVAYALSKSLIFKLAELFNAEGDLKNVLTSVIVPGIIDTPANRKAMPDADIAKWMTPQSIADVIYDFVMEKRRESVIKLYS